MKSYNLFSVVLIIGLLLLALACSDSVTEPYAESGEEPSTKTYIPTMDDIDQIARSLSILLENKEYRELIENKIKASTYVENIVEVSMFFNSKEMFLDSEKKFFKSRAKQGKTILSDIVETLPPNIADDFKRNISALKFGLIDIYFPIVEHRNTWSAEKELIVAPLNSKIIKENDSYSGYLIGGEKTKFSREPDPNKHVLVVCPSEKSGNYTNSFSENTTIKNSINYSITSEGGGTTTRYYRTYLKELYFQGNYDPWGGDVEVYIKLRKKFGNNYTSWTEKHIGDISPRSTLRCNIMVASSRSNYHYQLEVWDDDDWFTGSDDKMGGVEWVSWIGDNKYCTELETYRSRYDGKYWTESDFSWYSSKFRLLINSSDADPDYANDIYVKLYHVYQ